MNFNSLEDLKDRLIPALEKRSSDLNLLGFNKTADDIWKELAINKWKDSVSLSLADMVDDILKYIPEWDSDEVEK